MRGGGEKEEQFFSLEKSQESSKNQTEERLKGNTSQRVRTVWITETKEKKPPD